MWKISYVNFINIKKTKLFTSRRTQYQNKKVTPIHHAKSVSSNPQIKLSLIYCQLVLCFYFLKKSGKCMKNVVLNPKLYTNSLPIVKSLSSFSVVKSPTYSQGHPPIPKSHHLRRQIILKSK